MRITRPNVKKLNLDLAEFSGGDSYPSQFFGRTHAGREVYARYRYGRLSVRFDDADDWLFDHRIGDVWDGAILLEQVCDLAGITIQGQMPILTPEAFAEARENDPIKDWSGETTYWSFHMRYTAEAARTFLLELEKIIAGVVIGQQRKDGDWITVASRISDFMTSFALYYAGLSVDDEAIKQAVADRSVVVPGIARSRMINLNMPTTVVEATFRPLDNESASDLSGRNIEVPRMLSGNIAGEIETNDLSGQRTLAAIEALVERHFFDRFKQVDIDNGEVLKRYEGWKLHSRDVIAWCEAGENRYLSDGKTEDVPPRSCGILPDV